MIDLLEDIACTIANFFYHEEYKNPWQSLKRFIKDEFKTWNHMILLNKLDIRLG